MNRMKSMLLLAMMVLSAVACDKNNPVRTEELFLEVNVNNISGQWELKQWNGEEMAEGTYVYLDLERKDMTYTMYQNVDSFSDVPHVITGRYALSTDVSSGTVIRGSYDHDSGDWTHRYVIKWLTADAMLWVATDDSEVDQMFVRVDSIPVAE